MISLDRYRQPSQFRIGDVLALSWRVLSRHFLTFVALVGILDVLNLALNAYGQAKGHFATNFLVILPLQMALSSLGHATVALAVFQDLRGRQVSAADSLRQVVARFFPIVGLALVLGAASLSGLLCFLVPGLFVMAAWAVAMPVCVVERLGVWPSVWRSSALTAGQRWPILGVGVAWLLVSILVGSTILRVMPGATAPTRVLQWIWMVASGSFQSVYTAILYYDLRAVREGIGLEEIAALFD